MAKTPPRTSRTSAAKTMASSVSERILAEALRQAELVGWERVRLRAVAVSLDIPLGEIFTHYRDLDAVADAWLRRGLDAMLRPEPVDFAELPASDRLEIMLMRWFEAFSAHRRVTLQMLGTKLYPSHPHHWVPLIFNLSRIIQWLREAALCDAGGLRRQVEEVGLTSLFLATLAVWARDKGPSFELTRSYLRRRLRRSDVMMTRLWGKRPLPGVDQSELPSG